jgi:SAM-dependent methyltransferase
MALSMTALLRTIAKRVSDGAVLHMLRQWLKSPVAEYGEAGRLKRTRERTMEARRATQDGQWREGQLLDFILSLRQLDLVLAEIDQRALEDYARTHARRFAMVLNVFASLIPRGAQIFSVGSMPNLLELLVAREFDARVVGSAFNPPDTRKKFTAIYESSSSWRYEMEMHLLDATRDPLPVGTGSCDLVFCFEVVEHFLNSPLSLFREIKRALRPSGHLLLSTPNLQHWHRLLSWINGTTYPDVDFQTPLESRHTHVFSFRELNELLSAADFEIVDYFFEDPWENAKHLRFDLSVPLNRAACDLLANREEFQHECIFIAARPVCSTGIFGESWHRGSEA